MKKFVIALIFALVTCISYSQVSIGKLVRFPDSNFIGLAGKPQLGFTKFDENNFITLRTCQGYSYASFDNDSRILIRFADETIVKLPMIGKLGVSKDFYTEVISGKVYSYYITYTQYEIDEETINKITVEKVPIIKIRVAFSNGNVTDYDIKPGYQQKLLDGLIKSYNDATSQNEIRKANNTDDDF